MKDVELRQRLHVDEVGPSELRQVLMYHFGGAQYQEGDIVDYLHDGEVALAVTFATDDDRIVAVSSGPALTEEDLSEIESKLRTNILAATGSKVRREIIFAAVPVTGSWRYNDRFQIMPAPDNAPRPPAVIGDHPLVLEVKHPDSPDFMIALERALEVLSEVNLILAGVVPWVDARRWGHVRQLWAIAIGDEPMPTRSNWVQEAYWLDEFQAITEELTRDPGPPLDLVDNHDYYARRGISAESILELPASIEVMFDRFYALDRKRHGRFLRWAYWLNHSRAVFGLSRSAHYIAVIQAIEALRPQIPDGPRCRECGRPTGESSTSQFIDFVDQYVPRRDDGTELERRNLYWLRSALTHGGKLLTDDLTSLDFAPRPNQERQTAEHASALARLAGVNWLMLNGD